MLALITAFLLDLRIGDPVYRFHPVRIMGTVIRRGEEILRRRIQNEKLAGAMLAFFMPPAVGISTWCLIEALAKIHPLSAWTASVFGIYSSISIQDLRKEAAQIYADLGKGDLTKARTDLSRIVGRDTKDLDQKEIIRATVETVAESTLDGVIAPLFYAALGGAPLALAYKAVNTLDSMIGHTNERYLRFGFTAAKQDELWNWLPARLSLCATSLAAFFVTQRSSEAFFTGWHHGVTASQTNGAIPEAAFAGALGLRLGGPSTYDHGKVIEKPFMGFAVKGFDREDILKSVRLMTAAAWVMLIFSLMMKALFVLASS